MSGTPRDPYKIVEFGGGAFVRNQFPHGKSLMAQKLSSTGLLIIIIAGQSLGANTCSGDYVCANPTLVGNFNIYDGGTYTASNPLLGCTGDLGDLISPGVQKHSNLFLRVADKVIAAGIASRVLLVPTSVGGTSAAQHAAAGSVLKEAVLIAMRELVLAGYDLQTVNTMVGWQQGTADRLTLQAAYQASMELIMNPSRDAGFDKVKWLLAKETRNDTLVGTGQQAAVDALVAAHPTYCFLGPDSDSVDQTKRYDLVHFDATGADDNATLWKNAIDAAF